MRKRVGKLLSDFKLMNDKTTVIYEVKLFNNKTVSEQ